MSKRSPKTVSIDVTERFRLQAEHDGITLAEAARQAIAFWVVTREDSIAAGKRNEARLIAKEAREAIEGRS